MEYALSPILHLASTHRAKTSISIVALICPSMPIPEHTSCHSSEKIHLDHGLVQEFTLVTRTATI